MEKHTLNKDIAWQRNLAIMGVFVSSTSYINAQQREKMLDYQTPLEVAFEFGCAAPQT